jgi:hypothetical protein
MSTAETVFDVTYGGLGATLTGAQARELDRVAAALTAVVSALDAAWDYRGATPSRVAARAGVSLLDAGRLLERLVTDGAATRTGAGRFRRYRPVAAA